MPRDIVSERRHRHNLKRKAVQKRKLMAKGGSGKHKYGSMGSDDITVPGGRWRSIPMAKGPKKFKWKRDVLEKARARDAREA